MAGGARRDPARAVKPRLQVRRKAKADVLAAARWYEQQRKGLGRELVAEIDRALERVADNPLMYQVVERSSQLFA